MSRVIQLSILTIIFNSPLQAVAQTSRSLRINLEIVLTFNSTKTSEKVTYDMFLKNTGGATTFLIRTDCDSTKYAELYSKGIHRSLLQYAEQPDFFPLFMKSAKTANEVAINENIIRPIYFALPFDCPDILHDYRRPQKIIRDKEYVFGHKKIIFDEQGRALQLTYQESPTHSHYVTRFQYSGEQLRSFTTEISYNGKQLGTNRATVNTFDTAELDDSLFVLEPTEYGTWITDLTNHTQSIFRSKNDIRPVLDNEPHDYQYLLKTDPPGHRRSNRLLYFTLAGVIVLTLIVWKTRRKNPVT